MASNAAASPCWARPIVSRSGGLSKLLEPGFLETRVGAAVNLGLLNGRSALLLKGRPGGTPSVGNGVPLLSKLIATFMTNAFRRFLRRGTIDVHSQSDSRRM